ncbi:IclR family transcriptional regulator [Brevibacterium yomogidense]|uniref:IclR family transcriptional regulator n=1 Tax=Brevibacterium yomogidense TaxID=946573 RepID=UPI0018DF1D3B|nr:helix-turn-helix domain-containing protein [Brevibacterium yomogidense]
MAGDGGAPKGGLGTIRNATLLMDLLARSPYLHQLTDLAQQSGMTVPTVHRLLRSLVHAEYAVQDPATSRYGLGRAMTRLAVHQLSTSPILTALNPFMIGLRDQLAATIGVHVLISGEAVSIDQVEAQDRGPFRRPLRAVPALESASGRILAAHASDEEWERAVAISREGSRGLGDASPGDDPDGGLPCAEHREEWRAADHVVFESSDPTAPNEVAVAVRAADGTVVAALSADLQPSSDARAVAAVLLRTAVSCGRSIAHG